MINVASLPDGLAGRAQQVEQVRSLVDVALLVGWGWGPASHVWTVEPTQSIFDYRKCAVAGCDHDGRSAEGLCTGCRHRWRKGALPLEEFLAQPFARDHGLDERLCAVCCTPGHLRPVHIRGIVRPARVYGAAATNPSRRSSPVTTGSPRLGPTPR